MSVLFKQMSGRLGHRAGWGRWALSMRLSLLGGGWLAGSVRGQRLGASQPHWVGDRFDTAWHLTYSCPLIRPPHWHKGSREYLFLSKTRWSKARKTVQGQISAAEDAGIWRWGTLMWRSKVSPTYFLLMSFGMFFLSGFSNDAEFVVFFVFVCQTVHNIYLTTSQEDF